MADRPQASVSLCMIVRDEEHNLGDCLTPVADLFDQIVIVDTGSQDRTRQVARQFTPLVFDFAWCDDFSAARNESLRHARCEWVMWLDADDRVRPENVVNLRALLNSLDARPRVFLMDTLCLLEPGEEPNTVTHPRLFRRHPDLRWRGRVHEQLDPEPAELGYEWVFSDVQIVHLGYVDRVTSERKRRRKLRLLHMDYAVDPDNCSTLLHLGLTHLGMGNVAEARRHLLRLAESQDASAALLRCVYAVFANLSSLDGDYSGAVQFAERGLALFPDDEHFLYAKAHAMYALQDYASAERALIRIIQAPAPRRMHFGETANIRHKLAPHLLAAICFMKGEYRQAEESYVALLRDFPDHAGTWYNLGLIFVATGERQKLEWVLRELRGCAAGKLDAQLLVARWRLARGELAAAGALIDQLIEQAPQSPYPRMIRVECLANCQSPLDAQVKAIRDVLRVDPANVQARAWMAQIERAQRAVTAVPAAAWSGTVAVGSGVAVG